MSKINRPDYWTSITDDNMMKDAFIIYEAEIGSWDTSDDHEWVGIDCYAAKSFDDALRQVKENFDFSDCEHKPEDGIIRTLLSLRQTGQMIGMFSGVLKKGQGKNA